MNDATGIRTHNLYYRLKPVLPVSIRRGVRRWFALRKRRNVGSVWPVLPGSERPPPGWPGWPDGKKFAFVLTHDVEGQRGVDRCRKLMDLEMKWKFRSSFNFIPEGDYSVTGELREEMTGDGFEIGVHDLRHDGNLFNSRSGFGRNATEINRYLKEWGAVGFRAGFMLHRLDWLTDLEIQYDASTFDTDPFEPQPDGVGTIFPFWKECANGRGYVELPYTLPQDSTLFILFREPNLDIWLRKLDWVASNGGMALVNVHPDYMRFEGEAASHRSYPAEFYSRLLQYVREKYGQSVWHALPKEVAAFAASVKPAPPRPPKRICMVTYSKYLSDTRVIRYAEALAQRGDHVDVLSLRELRDLPDCGVANNVNIFRMGSRIGKGEKGITEYLAPVLLFLVSCTWWIARRHRKQPYDLLHIHNVPDFLVFAGAYPRLTGAKVVLDIHDIVPELYCSKFRVGEDSITAAALRLIERICAKWADQIIISNHLWLEKYAARTGATDRCSVFINNVDTEMFRRRPRTRNDGRFVILFPGSLQWHQGVGIAIRAFQEVSAQESAAEFHIYGDGIMKKELISLAAELKLDSKVKFFEPLPAQKIVEVMSNADLGVVPKRADSFGNEAYSTKIMEFMSLGIPVVASGTKIDRFYFNDNVVRFFESGNVDALAAAILEMIRNPDQRLAIASRASEYAALNSWEARKADYLRLVDSLCSSGWRGRLAESQGQGRKGLLTLRKP